MLRYQDEEFQGTVQCIAAHCDEVNPCRRTCGSATIRTTSAI